MSVTCGLVRVRADDNFAAMTLVPLRSHCRPCAPASGEASHELGLRARVPVLEVAHRELREYGLCIARRLLRPTMVGH